ncbi:hypothetical protein GCM10027294_43730 [Marinactinospora endophytica]
MPDEWRNVLRAASIVVTLPDGQTTDLQTFLNDLENGGEITVAWADVTGKPATFPPTAHTHAAGDITSGTIAFARLPTGTTASTVAVGNHTHTVDQVTDATAVGRSVMTAADAAAARSAIGAGTSSLALGTTGTTAAAGNHSHPGLMTGAAQAVADSAATDVAGLVADVNGLFAALRSRGVIA